MPVANDGRLGRELDVGAGPVALSGRTTPSRRYGRAEAAGRHHVICYGQSSVSTLTTPNTMLSSLLLTAVPGALFCVQTCQSTSRICIRSWPLRSLEPE